MNEGEEKIICTGGLPSPKDYRDVALSSVVIPIDLPDNFEVDVTDIPIWYQKKIGCCVGAAGAKYKQRLDKEDIKQIVPLSFRFLYSVCKCMDGVSDEGTYPRLSMQVLKNYGCATESTIPNNTDLDHETFVYNRKIENIPNDAIEEAKKYKISSFASVDISKEGIKSAVFQAAGCSMLVKLGIEWYTDKEGYINWNPEKIFPIRAPGAIISGHQIYVYKYETVGDDLRIWFLNSWSDKWGISGKGYFMWSEYRNFIVEAWTAIDIPQSLLDNVNTLPKPGEFKYNFQSKIKYGETSDSVKALQIALKIEGLFNFPYVTGFYGSITARAVLDFQIKHNIPLSWYEKYVLAGKLVGPKTLSVLNQIFNK